MISKEDVKHIAKLARLELSEKELVKMQKDLTEILDYFTVLKKTSRNNTESYAEKRGRKNILRKDEVLPRDPNLANDLLRLAPATQEGYIKVKAVL